MPEKEKNTAEELAGMYRIIKETGGCVVDWKGNSIERKEIGLLDSKNHNVVAAASDNLAREIVREIIPERYR